MSQEAKLEIIDDFICAAIWGSMGFVFSYRSSVRGSRGILILWDAL